MYLVLDPCYPKGLTVTVENDFDLIGTGDFDSCRQSLIPLLNKTHCRNDSDTCSLDGAFQPSLSSTNDFFGFSEFYYTSQDCLKIAGKWDLDLFSQKSREYCGTEWGTLMQNLKSKMYLADENRLKDQCFKSAWVSVSNFFKSFSSGNIAY